MTKHPVPQTTHARACTILRPETQLDPSHACDCCGGGSVSRCEWATLLSRDLFSASRDRQGSSHSRCRLHPERAVDVARTVVLAHGITDAEIAFIRTTTDGPSLGMCLRRRVPTYFATLAMGLPSRVVSVTVWVRLTRDGRLTGPAHVFTAAWRPGWSYPVSKDGVGLAVKVLCW